MRTQQLPEGYRERVARDVDLIVDVADRVWPIIEEFACDWFEMSATRCMVVMFPHPPRTVANFNPEEMISFGMRYEGSYHPDKVGPLVELMQRYVETTIPAKWRHRIEWRIFYPGKDELGCVEWIYHPRSCIPMPRPPAGGV